MIISEKDIRKLIAESLGEKIDEERLSKIVSKIINEKLASSSKLGRDNKLSTISKRIEKSDDTGDDDFSLSPSTAKGDISSAHQKFRPKLRKLIRAMKGRGFEPAVQDVFRSMTDQKAANERGVGYKDKSRILGSHTAFDKKGRRSAIAADIVDAKHFWGVSSAGQNTQKAYEFFVALGEEAKKLDLIWGGDWQPYITMAGNSIGWDPAHVQYKYPGGEEALNVVSRQGLEYLRSKQMAESIIRDVVGNIISEKLKASKSAGGSTASSRMFSTSRQRSHSDEDDSPDAGEVGKTRGSNKLTSLNPSAADKFRAFISDATQKGYTIKITSAQRMPSHQWNLRFGNRRGITPAQPCRSDHQYGYAIDINFSYKKDERRVNVNSKSPNSKWQPIVDIAKSHGIRWQGASDRVHFFVQGVGSSQKANCDKFFARHLGTDVPGRGSQGTQIRKGWGSGSMKKAEEENPGEIKSILGLAENKILESKFRNLIREKLKSKDVDSSNLQNRRDQRSQDRLEKKLGSGQRSLPSEMSISNRGLKKLKRDEGVRYQVYDDATGKVISSYDEAQGHPTIGVGHLVYHKSGTSTDQRERWKNYLGGKSKLSDSQVDELFRSDIASHTKKFKSQITEPITQNMFDALASYAFNAGAAAPKRDGIVDAINSGDFRKAAEKIRSGPTAGGLAGLVRRRGEEADLFLA